MRADHKQPIFIVGAPRSGTTLLAAMLGAHSHMSSGPETRFFHFIAKADIDQLLVSWPENAIDFLFSVVLINPIPDHYGISRSEIRSYLEGQTPSVQAILSSLTEQYMRKEGKQRWAEKSPENTIQLDLIRQYFPSSPVIRILRDPRDVALSMIKTNDSWSPPDIPEALILWRKFDERSATFFLEDENCYTINYENLILSPELELTNLCSFIGEEFEHQMLDTSRSASNVVTEKETWKRLVYKPVDKTRIGVWKKEFSAEQKRVAEALVGDRCIAYEYEWSEKFDSTAVVFPSIEHLLIYRECFTSFVNEGSRFWQSDVSDNEVTIFVGNPDRDNWLSHKKPDRWWQTIQIFYQILRDRFAGHRIYWVTERDVTAQFGLSSRLLNIALRVFGERIPCYASLEPMYKFMGLR